MTNSKRGYVVQGSKQEVVNVYLLKMAGKSVGVPVLQIKRDNRDNLGIISHISPRKNIFCDTSLEPSRRDGSNEGHNICFHREIRNITFELSAISLLSGGLVYTLTIFQCFKKIPWKVLLLARAQPSPRCKSMEMSSVWQA